MRFGAINSRKNDLVVTIIAIIIVNIIDVIGIYMNSKDALRNVFHHIIHRIYRHIPFLITFANAGQYGNDVYIAPGAKPNDGKLHLVVLKQFPMYMIPFIALKIFKGKAHKSRYINTLMCEEATVHRKNAGVIHFDGEPGMANESIEVRIIKNALKVIC